MSGKKWDSKCRRNVVRVSQERTWEGRLFQIVGAAERKPRAPNEMLQRVTDRRLAEADRRVLHGVCHSTRLAKYGGKRGAVTAFSPSLPFFSFSVPAAKAAFYALKFYWWCHKNWKRFLKPVIDRPVIWSALWASHAVKPGGRIQRQKIAL